MKSLIIGAKVAYGSSAKPTDLTTLAEGAIACICLKDDKVLTGKPVYNFSIACGRGDNKLPYLIPEVDVKSLTATKASYEAGVKFSAKIAIPSTIVEDKDFTLIVAKKKVVFNERNRWTATTRSKSTSTATTIAEDLAKRINYMTEASGVTATAKAGVITVTAEKFGDDYELIPADELYGTVVTTTIGKDAVLDKAYVQNLAKHCAADKGVEYVAEDGVSIYPNYPEAVAEEQYVMYTLRFAVPRAAAMQLDEVVNQVVHICVPVGAGCIGTLDSIFGVAAPSAGA